MSALMTLEQKPNSVIQKSVALWTELELGKILNVKHGYAFKSSYFSEQGKYIVLTPGNFWEKGGFKLRPGKDRYYSTTFPSEYILNQGDVIIAMTEQGEGLLGSSAFIPEPDIYLHNQRLGLIQEKYENSFNSRFIYYLFNTKIVRDQIRASATGTKVKHTAPDRIKKVKVKIPDTDTQKRISDILSAYDDLIENNQRRIELLEQSARLLYKEWFVHFRFPSHEHVRMIDGLPEEWSKKTAFEVMDVLSGGTPKTTVAEYWSGTIPFFTPKDTTNTPYVFETEKMITEEGLKKCNSKLYLPNTLFITARGTVGKLQLAQVPMAMNQSCYALIAKPPLTQFFLYLSLKEAINQFKSRASGAVFDAIVVDTFKLIPYTLPSEALITDFTNIVSPIFQQIENLQIQVDKLKNGRDLLLPKLMSGEIPI